ncbi:hypothetical protein SZMC14600_14190 [Saccharomonospora azurea SZMC 14600]|nr:hypothetical protein SZMC14600_14190 [Saccharomonospora azurea SZMC 14600]
MNLFLFDDDTVPLPPITTSQAVQRVLSVFDALSRGLGRPRWCGCAAGRTCSWTRRPSTSG